MVYSGAGGLAHDEGETTPSSESQGTPSRAAQVTPSSEVEGTPSSEVEGTPSNKAQGAPSRTAQVTPSSKAQGAPSSEAQGTPSTAGQGTPISAATSTVSSIRFVTPPPSASPNIDADYSGEPLRFRLVDDIVGIGSPPGQAAHVLDDLELHLGSAEEPPNFAAAEQEARWRAAMLEEMAAVEENRTWELVDPPAGCRPIGLKWVFKVKWNERGEVVRHKARLIAKGFVQHEGINFEEVFAPVALMESVRLLLALAAVRCWKVHHLDVKSAFLNGELAEEVYVQQPPGFVIAGEERRVLRSARPCMGCVRHSARETSSSTPASRHSASPSAPPSTPSIHGGRTEAW